MSLRDREQRMPMLRGSALDIIEEQLAGGQIAPALSELFDDLLARRGEEPEDWTKERPPGRISPRPAEMTLETARSAQSDGRFPANWRQLAGLLLLVSSPPYR